MDIQADLLIVTDIRRVSKAVLDVFQEVTRQPPKPTLVDGHTYHDLGVVNSTKVFMVQSEMGSKGVEYAVHNGIAALSPSATIMVSLAFGTRPYEQSIGDILVSQQLVICDLPPIWQKEIRKIKQEDDLPEIIPRSERPHASPWLINCFQNADIYRDESKTKVWFGSILSIDAIIANDEFIVQLLELSPRAIGGEIGGTGLYTACRDRKVDWILVDAITDCGDLRQKFKKSVVPTAAHNAAKYVLHTLQVAPIKREVEHILQHPLHQPVDTKQEGNVILLSKGEQEMKLQHNDCQRLYEELNKFQGWKNGIIGERGVLTASGLPDSLIDSMILTGATMTDTPNVIAALERHGNLVNRPTHHAIGALAEYLLENTSVQGKVFLAYLIKRYQLITSLDYLRTLQEQYGLLELPISKELYDLGWNIPQPDFLWQGSKNADELEKVWSKITHFLEAVFLEKGAKVAHSVCRVELSTGERGTGFTIGKNLVLTNHHVVPTDAEAKETVVRFGHRFNAAGQLEEGNPYKVKRAIRRSGMEELDYVVLETEGNPGEDENIGYLKLIGKSLQVGKPAFIIQHPSGQSQRVVLQNNAITYVAPDNRRVQYLTNTMKGSSGSPVCNEQWEVVALHHSGAPIPQTPKTLNVQGNEGIPMLAILPEIEDLLAS